MATTAPALEFIGPMPEQYETYGDCSCCDCDTCEEMFWPSRRGTGKIPICPGCGQIGTRPDDCQGCTDGLGGEWSDTRPFIACQLTPIPGYPDGLVCMAPGNLCTHYDDRV